MAGQTNCPAIRGHLSRALGLAAHDHIVRGADGVRTAYFSMGEGPPLLLLHGALAHGFVWSPILGELARRYRLFVPDVLGHGGTDKPFRLYDRPAYARWLRHFCDALQLERVNLLGNSLGGGIALEFARQFPARVERLVLANAIGLGRPRAPSAAYLRDLLWIQAFPNPAKPERARRLWAAVSQGLDFNDPTNRLIGEYTLATLAAPGGRRPFWLGQTPATKPFSVGELSAVTAPTLQLHGQDDAILPLEDACVAGAAVRWRQFRPMQAAGHAPFLDQPAAFVQEVESFLKA